MKETDNCNFCIYHEELQDQSDEGEVSEDMCICKLNKSDYHYDHCLSLDYKPCPFFRSK